MALGLLAAEEWREATLTQPNVEPGEGLAYLDATKRFPFEDGSLHYVFSEHVIEHLTYDEGKLMMAEAYRVLDPGGKMRISTPNLTRFIELFDKDPSEDARSISRCRHGATSSCTTSPRWLTR